MDLIDRQAAIDELKKHRALYCDNTPETFSRLSYAQKSRVDELDTAIATLVNLPSARPKGEWIKHEDDFGFFYECPMCHYFTSGFVNYCAKCGAELRETE